MSETSETPPTEPLVYPPSPGRLALLATLALAFVAGGIYLLDAARRGHQPPAAGLAGLASVVFFGACGAWAIRRLASREPLLIADEDGLRDNGSAIGAGLLRWDEIADLHIYRFRGHAMLGITPVDLDAVLGRLKRWRRAAARANIALGTPPFNVPQSVSKVPLERMFREIEERYGDRLARREETTGGRPDD